MPVEDLRSVSAAERESALRLRLEEEARRTFDLSRLPLLRARIFELSSTEHVLLLVMHHIVTDGWSIEVLLRELKLLYEARLAGREASLPDLSAQYLDYARWQRQWLSGSRLAEHLAYWRGRLAGAPRALELPVGRPRPRIPSHRGRRYPVRIPRALTDSIKQLTRSCGATLFMTLLASFQAFLFRLTGQEDICIGTPVAGRSRKETEALIGFFVNTVVMRTLISADESFRRLVERVRNMAIEAYGYLETPFEKVVEAVDPERSQGHSPLFQVLFALQTGPQEALQLGGATVQPLDIDAGTSKFDLTLSLQESGGEIEGIVEYSTDLFDEPSIARMVSNFRVLLEAAVANPERKVGELEFIDPAELHQVLIEWNRTARFQLKDASVIAQFEAQAAARPDAVAIVSEAREMSYRELNALSNRIARRLRALGATRGARVGVCADRSVEMIGGLLGVLKAGAAYVPIDPSYPHDRLRFMLEDAGATVVLTQTVLTTSLAGLAEHIIALDDGSFARADDADDANLSQQTTPGDLVYVIFTSGSTGRPKGAGAYHSGVANLVHWYRHEFGLSQADRGVLATSFSFDLTQKNIFAALTAGASLHLAPEPFDPRAVARLVEREKITWLNLTPSMFYVVGESARGAELATLRLVFLGGEPVQAGRLRELRTLDRTRRPLYVNTYGPTECSDVSAYHRLGIELEMEEERAVPIGRPIPNVRLYVLDRSLTPLPICVPGELYIGGEGVGAGYLGRPDLTAERFVPDPFSDAPGSRLYRSGDLCRWLPSGEIEYLGRIDAQVKIRGFRIEPAEIEIALTQHPAVREAVVVPQDDARGAKRLVAYLVARDRPAPATALRDHLSRTLPEFMMPSACIWMDALPLSPNGKVDWKALPRTPQGEEERDDPESLPRSPTEELVASFWADVLGRNRVSTHASFFELGGHSLLAMQLISRLRSKLGVEIPLRTFFAIPTVAGLATHVDAAMAGSAPPPIAIARSAAGERPLSFAQQRLWFLDQLEPGGSVYNIPVVLRLEGRLDVDALRVSFETLVHRHEILRTAFVTRGGEPFQVVHPPVHWVLPRHDLRSLDEAERCARLEKLTRAVALQPFDLGEGRLLRTSLFQLGDEQHVLVIAMHHIVSDGWSMGVLLRGINGLYAAACAGKELRLFDLPLQYGDYAAWERSRLEGTVLEESRRVLASEAGRAAAAEPARGLAAASAPKPSRWGKVVRAGCRAHVGAEAPRQPERCHALHDASRGVRGLSPPALRPGGVRSRYSGRKPGGEGRRAAHRLFREHAGSPGRPPRRPELRGVARPCPSRCARGLRTPGAPF